MKDKATKGRFSAEESNRLLRDFLSPRLFDLGLICRAEDKGEPVVQLSPPLVAGPEDFGGIARILRQALSEAWDRINGSSRARPRCPLFEISLPEVKGGRTRVIPLSGRG